MLSTCFRFSAKAVCTRQSHFSKYVFSVNQVRTTSSFFNKLPAERLWKSVISVSNAGKKRGRGRGSGRKVARDLNKGQVIGVGKVPMVWPGLNAPIVQGREVVQQTKLPPDPEYQEKLNKIRDSMGSGYKRLKLHPLERGWSGTKLGGRSISKPDPVGDDEFEGFDTIVLEHKQVAHMTGKYGRMRVTSTLSVTGNRNGVAGFALGGSTDPRTAIRRSKNRAGQRLMFIERYNNSTVFHDFVTQFGFTTIHVFTKPPGFGLVCHRIIRAICQMIGITDIYAKIDGAKNPQSITKAFFLGLLRQKTHHQLAEEKGLHVVEFRKETGEYPHVVASPTKCRTSKEIPIGETLDVAEHILDGKVPYWYKPPMPFFYFLKGYETHIRRTERFKNKHKVRHQLLVNYGEIRSFLCDQYPECRFIPFNFDEWKKKKMEQDQ